MIWTRWPYLSRMPLQHGPLRLDPTHPLAQHLLGAWVFNTPNPINLRTGERSVAAGTAQITAGLRGKTLSLLATTVDSVNLVANSGLLVPTAGPFAAAFRLRKRDATNRESGAFGVNDPDSAQRCGGHLPFSDGNYYWDFGGTGAGNRLSYTPASVSDNALVLTTGARGMEIWRNGVKEASNADNPTRSGSTGAFTLGLHGGTTPGADLVDHDYFYVYRSQLSAELIRMLAVAALRGADDASRTTMRRSLRSPPGRRRGPCTRSG